MNDIGGFLKAKDWILFDCDGVLWRGGEQILGAASTLEKLRELNKRLLFVTNNATKSRASCAEQLCNIGIRAEADEIVCSASITASFLTYSGFKGSVYVVGEGGLITELEAAGFSVVGKDDGLRTFMKASEIASLPLDPSVKAVVVGLNSSINYYILSQAVSYLLADRECLFIATNTDSTYPSIGGRMLPGAGTVVAAISCGASRKPIVMGKPELPAVTAIQHISGFDASRALMVGDRLDTDILFGQKAGMDTLLVLTGVTSEEDARNSSIKPTVVLPSISDLAQYL